MQEATQDKAATTCYTEVLSQPHLQEWHNPNLQFETLKRTQSPPSNAYLEIRRYPAVTEGNRILFCCSPFPVRKSSTNNERCKKEGTLTAIHLPLHLNFKMDHKPNDPSNMHLMICKYLIMSLSYRCYSIGETLMRISCYLIHHILEVENKTASELY